MMFSDTVYISEMIVGPWKGGGRDVDKQNICSFPIHNLGLKLRLLTSALYGTLLSNKYSCTIWTFFISFEREKKSIIVVLGKLHANR